VTHPVRGIKGSDLLGFDSTAVKNRIKGKNTAITYMYTYILCTYIHTYIHTYIPECYEVA